MYLYRAIDKVGATVEFQFSPTRNLGDAKAFFRKAYRRHGLPVQVTIDRSQTNFEAARACHGPERIHTSSTAEPLTVRPSRYMNNLIEQDHRRIKRRVRSMMGFKSPLCASVILGGIEMVHMIRKGQMDCANGQVASLADQFDLLAA